MISYKRSINPITNPNACVLSLTRYGIRVWSRIKEIFREGIQCLGRDTNSGCSNCVAGVRNTQPTTPVHISMNLELC
jgi:hypothetical protein